MRIQKRQRLYGTLFGASAFAVGWLATYLLAPSPVFEDIARWQEVTWLFLGAHFIEISETQIAGLSGLGSTVDPVNAAGVPMIRALPPLLIALAGVLANNVIGYSTRAKHLLKNAASVLLGYFPLLLLAYAQSMARPGISLALTLAVIGFLSVYVGSVFVSKATGGFPMIGFVSLGGIALIGLFVMFVGVSLAMSLWPAAAIAAASVAVAAGLVYVERSVPT